MIEITYLQLATVIFVSYAVGIGVCALLTWLLLRSERK